MNKKPALILLMLTFSMLTATIFRANAPAVTQLSIINPDTENNDFKFTHGTPVGATFVARVIVSNASNLNGWQMNVTWDPQLLQIATTDDLYQPTNHVFQGKPTYPTGKDIDNTHGRLLWACSLGLGQTPFSGTGTIIEIKFTIAKVSAVEGEILSCNLTIDRVGEFPTALSDPDAIQIPFNVQNGYYEYSWAAPPPPPEENATIAVNPSRLINSSMVPPKTFQINITLRKIENLYGYNFELSYNASVLYCLSLTVLDALNETNYIPSFSINNALGKIWVNVTYYPPAVPLTTNLTVAFVTMTFRVKGIGVSVLDLNNTILTDSFGRLTTHDVEDGIFANVIRDIAVTEVTTPLPFAYPGWKVRINVTVGNKGETIETFDLKVYYGTTLVKTVPIQNLGPSNETKLTLTWDTKGVDSCTNYTIKAEVPILGFELDTSDNSLTDGCLKMRLMGDLDGNNTVNLFDITQVVSAFGSHEGYDHWKPEADMNQDLRVDIMDIIKTVRAFGTHCP